jgi:PIN domain nuclease of toxin-antitoxin system
LKSYLLDTHVILWWLAGEPMTPEAMSVIRNRGEQLFLSSVSAWEIAVKRKLGKLEAPADLEEQIRATDVQILDLRWSHAWAAGEIALHHKDPFDRMIIAQARLEGMVLITADRRLGEYNVPMIYA